METEPYFHNFQTFGAHSHFESYAHQPKAQCFDVPPALGLNARRLSQNSNIPLRSYLLFLPDVYMFTAPMQALLHSR